MMPQDHELDTKPLSTEDGRGYIAVAPKSPGCMSDGETPEETLANAYDAVGCWIAAAHELAHPVPQLRRAAA